MLHMFLTLIIPDKYRYIVYVQDKFGPGGIIGIIQTVHQICHHITKFNM